MNTLLFSERQRFTQPWLWLLLMGTAIVSIIGTVLLAPMASLLVITVLLGVIAMLLVAHLQTEVWTRGVYYRFFPFHTTFRIIPPETISQYYIRRYNPIGEYSGWGLRQSRGSGRAYNVRGDVGMQLVLTNGQKILFGTQHKTAFQAAMDILKKQPDRGSEATVCK